MPDGTNGGTVVPMSVVIPTYNRPKILHDTLVSLLGGLVVPDEVIVVDQSDEVFDPEAPKGLAGGVRVIRGDVPSSTKSRNMGMAVAQNDVVLFCDDDILVNGESLSVLWEAMSSGGIALVAALNYLDNPLFVEQGTGVARDIAGTLLGMKKPWRRGGYVVRSNMRGRYSRGIDRPMPTEWAMGFFFCVRKSLAERWECFFDERLSRYAYAEDLDFTMRYCAAARAEGLAAIVHPGIWVNHLASAEWRTPKLKEAEYLVVNRRYLSEKIFPQKKGYRIAMDLFDLGYAMFVCRDSAYRKKMIECIRGYRRGILTVGDVQEACEA